MSHELLNDHPNIVRLLGIGWEKQKLSLAEEEIVTPLLIVELASLVKNQPLTLEVLIASSNSPRVNIELKTKLLADVAAGILALHELNVVHGDLKPSNVLIFDGRQGQVAKISDFGFSITGDDEIQTARGGTPLWNAPECLKEAPEDIRSERFNMTRDYYSLGLVMW